MDIPSVSRASQATKTHFCHVSVASSCHRHAEIFRVVYLLVIRGGKAVSPISINPNVNQEISDVFLLHTNTKCNKYRNAFPRWSERRQKSRERSFSLKSGTNKHKCKAAVTRQVTSPLLGSVCFGSYNIPTLPSQRHIPQPGP